MDKAIEAASGSRGRHRPPERLGAARARESSPPTSTPRARSCPGRDPVRNRFRRPQRRLQGASPPTWRCTSQRRCRATRRLRTSPPTRRHPSAQLRAEGRRGGQAGERPRADRRGSAREVAQGDRAARAGPRQRRQARRQDDRTAPRGSRLLTAKNIRIARFAALPGGADQPLRRRRRWAPRKEATWVDRIDAEPSG